MVKRTCHQWHEFHEGKKAKFVVFVEFVAVLRHGASSTLDRETIQDSIGKESQNLSAKSKAD